MQAITRLNKYKDTEFDKIILMIRNGTIKSGRYSHLVKVDKNARAKGKEFFTDGSKVQ